MSEARNGREAVEQARRRNILDKLHVQNRAQVVAYAMRNTFGRDLAMWPSGPAGPGAS